MCAFGHVGNMLLDMHLQQRKDQVLLLLCPTVLCLVCTACMQYHFAHLLPFH